MIYLLISDAAKKPLLESLAVLVLLGLQRRYPRGRPLASKKELFYQAAFSPSSAAEVSAKHVSVKRNFNDL